MQTSRRNGQIPELNGLRAIAILLVVIFHVTPFSALSKPSSLLDYLLLSGFSLGWCGVDLFFVLSGFLITGILVDSKGDSGYFRKFYIRRTLRILPLYYAVAALFSFVALPFIRTHHQFFSAHSQEIWRSFNSLDVASIWLYMVNIRTSVKGPVPFVGHFWSLAVEEQFYLVWPVIVFLLRRNSLLAFSLLGALASCVGRFVAHSAGVSSFALYHLTPFRVEPLLIGAAVALVIRNNRWCAGVQRVSVYWIGLALVGIVSAIASAGTTEDSSGPMQTFGFSSLAILFAAWILKCSQFAGSDGLVYKFLRSEPLQRIGKLSYCLYVVHVIIRDVILGAGGTLVRRGLWPHSFTAVALLGTVVIFTLSYLIAQLSWRYFEEPILRLKDKWAPYSSKPKKNPEAVASSSVQPDTFVLSTEPQA